MSQKTVSKNVGKVGGCIVKGIILADFAVIPGSLDTSAIAEYMYQCFYKRLRIDFYCFTWCGISVVQMFVSCFWLVVISP